MKPSQSSLSLTFPLQRLGRLSCIYCNALYCKNYTSLQFIDFLTFLLSGNKMKEFLILPVLRRSSCWSPLFLCRPCNGSIKFFGKAVSKGWNRNSVGGRERREGSEIYPNQLGTPCELGRHQLHNFTHPPRPCPWIKARTTMVVKTIIIQWSLILNCSARKWQGAFRS